MLYCYSKKCFTGIIILMLMLAKTSYAAMQDTTASKGSKTPNWITGTVINQDGRALKDVKVSVGHTNTFVNTDENGKFGINATTGSILVFEGHDYNVNKVTVSSDKDLNVRLIGTFLKRPAQIDVLYGTQSAESVLGSISTVYTDQLTTTPASLYVYALPGQLTGLYAQQTSGFTSVDNTSLFAPAIGLNFVNTASQNSRISDNTEYLLSVRGQTPVTIIDGIQRDISSIDPESIESISILKDALSTMLLGINSSRGVLLVTTRKAEAGRPRISFTAQSGIQTPLSLPTPLSSYQYAYLYNEALTNDGQAPFYTATDFNAYKNGNDPYGHPDVNWFNTILRKNSPESSYSLNVDGGAEVAKYTIGISYFDQGGIFNEAPGATYSTNNNLSRYTINSNVEVQVNKNLSVDLQLFGRVQQTTEPGGNNGGGISSILTALYGTPNNAYPVRNVNGSFGGSSLGSQYENNLLAMTEYSGYLQQNTNDILANLDLNYNLNSITKGLSLKLKGNVSYETENALNRSLVNTSYQQNKDSTYAALGTPAAQSNSFNTVFSERQTLAQASLNYNRQFGKSTFGAILLYNTQSLVTNYDLPAVTTNRALQVSYNYDGKYFAEGTINNSGYNRYTPGHQNGFFYAGGLGWQMAKEDFMKDIDWIHSWKWRATYGKTGNNNVDAYSYYGYVQTYSNPTQQTVYSTGTNYAYNSVYTENAIANPYLSWESANKLDIGTDISLFKDHLQLTADYYHDRYYDLLQVRGDNTALLGVPYPFENIGINLYHGLEFSATYQNNINKFNYFITGNISSQASKVIYSNEETQIYPWNVHTGLPTNVIFGYVADGLYQTAAEAAKGATLGSYTPKAGDIKLLDLNGDGVLNAFDEKPIANLKPLVFYGTTLGFNYDGFSVSVILQGVFNRTLETNTEVNTPFQGLGNFLGLGGLPPQGQAYVNATARWTPENAANAKLPELSFVNGQSTGYNSQTSTFWLESGDYLRIKNAEIGYTLPNSLTRKLKFSSIRVFVNGENLYTLAGYGGYDPEVAPPNYPIERVISAGITVKL
jgi:TonB-linked SusC/RagA family outer membrane protein